MEDFPDLCGGNDIIPVGEMTTMHQNNVVGESNPTLPSQGESVPKERILFHSVAGTDQLNHNKDKRYRRRRRRSGENSLLLRSSRWCPDRPSDRATANKSELSQAQSPLCLYRAAVPRTPLSRFPPPPTDFFCHQKGGEKANMK